MYLIDTDVMIYFLNGDPKVQQAMARHQKDPKAVSVITFGELLYGAAKSQRPLQNAARVRRVSEILPLIGVGPSIAELFGALKAEHEKQGERLDDFDLVIAATALTLNYAIVTNNEKHFQRIDGLRIDNWSR